MTERICAIEECGNGGRLTRGWCSKHYARWLKHGDPMVTLRAANGTMSGRTCAVDGCGGVGYCRGWCNRHYGRWREHGDPTVVLKPLAPRGSVPRFLSAVFDGTAPREPNGCILWPFGLTWGYAQLRWGGKNRKAGQLVLEHFVGPRPSRKHTMGHAPHDVCGHRNCVAPEHLSWQTYAENNRQLARIDKTHPFVTVDDAGVREAIARVHAGETRRAVAADLNVSGTTISNWVKGKVRGVGQ